VNKHNGLFTAGWNWAMTHLDGYDLIWMLNDDLEGATAQMLSDLASSVDWSKTAAITPAFNSPHGEFRPKPGQGLTEVRWIDWCCPLVNLEAWRSVGSFDEQFKGYGADLDWCRRAREQNWQFYVHHGHQIHHLGSQTAISQNLQRVQGNVKDMDRLMRAKWGVGWMEMK